jgi:hypothetical protein
VNSDLPAKSVVLDESDNVWFLGTSYLWKWVPVRKTIQKIKLKLKSY